MTKEALSDDLLKRLRSLSDAASPAPWTAMIEGRDHLSGDSFIMVGSTGDANPDIYVSRDSSPASAADLDLIAEARTYLPRLLDELDRLRTRGRSLGSDESETGQ